MATTLDGLFLKSPLSYKVRPLVIFNILDHYQRRSEQNFRVVGTLLGERKGNTIVVTNSFPVPHTETPDTVVLDLEFCNKWLELSGRVNSDEMVVGWYATGNEINYTSSLIHLSYAEQVEPGQPIHLLVDTDLNDFELAVRAFVATPVEVRDRRVYTKFSHVPIELKTFQAERVGVDALIKGIPEGNQLDAPTPVLSEFDDLQISLTRLLALLDQVGSYLDDVQEGKAEKNDDVGRAIANALAVVPHLEGATLERLFNNSLQDLLMVLYLSGLTRTQVALADRIHNINL